MFKRDRATAEIGRRLTYTLRITNHGPDEAANVHLSDTWTLGLKILSATTTAQPPNR